MTAINNILQIMGITVIGQITKITVQTTIDKVIRLRNTIIAHYQCIPKMLRRLERLNVSIAVVRVIALANVNFLSVVLIAMRQHILLYHVHVKAENNPLSAE